jgi:hypothetical protein
MGTNLITDHEFYCCICGEKGLPVIRRKGAEREAGHLKKLFCLQCKADTNHCECVPNTRYTKEDFWIEFQNHNFDKDGNRVRPYSELRRMINNEEI